MATPVVRVLVCINQIQEGMNSSVNTCQYSTVQNLKLLKLMAGSVCCVFACLCEFFDAAQ
jgi:hypothetical protein